MRAPVGRTDCTNLGSSTQHEVCSGADRNSGLRCRSERLGLTFDLQSHRREAFGCPAPLCSQNLASKEVGRVLGLQGRLARHIKRHGESTSFEVPFSLLLRSTLVI